MHYSAHIERRTSGKTDKKGTFQVISIEDDGGNNDTASIGIDQRKSFRSLEDLAERIERRTGEPAELDEA